MNNDTPTGDAQVEEARQITPRPHWTQILTALCATCHGYASVGSLVRARGGQITTARTAISREIRELHHVGMVLLFDRRGEWVTTLGRRDQITKVQITTSGRRYLKAHCAVFAPTRQSPFNTSLTSNRPTHGQSTLKGE